MTTTTEDITRLCAAIDGGDDSALPILADALEEAGDPRAPGLRRAVGRCPKKITPEIGAECDEEFGWAGWHRGPNRPHLVEPAQLRAVSRVAARYGGMMADRGMLNHPIRTVVFRLRSAAFLALAEAIDNA